jgi:hypothetical protein
MQIDLSSWKINIINIKNVDNYQNIKNIDIFGKNIDILPTLLDDLFYLDTGEDCYIHP